MNPADEAVSVRRAHLEDAAALALLGAATFDETFGHLYPPEDLQGFLAQAHSVDRWRATLSSQQNAVWVAEYAKEGLIGYTRAGPCKLPVEKLEPCAGEIQALYVLARFHNLGIGARLMEAGLDWLTSMGRSPLYLGVWSENYGAQRFYERYGFRKVGEYGFPVGATVDREFILKR